MAARKKPPKSETNMGIAAPTPGSNKIAPVDGSFNGKGANLTDPTESASESDPDEVILERMRKRFDRCVKAEAENRREMGEDGRFLAGEQWNAQDLQDRQRDVRPALTINKLPTFVHQVTNSMREERPTINVSPVGDRSDPEVAKMFRGMIRQIERASSAEVAYDTAFERSASLGMGYWRILTAFESPKTFDQCIRIERVRNIFTVYLDPDIMCPVASDARYGFVTDMMPRDEFDEQYPDADPVSFDLAGQGDSEKLWVAEDAIRIAEYFEIQNTKRELWLLSTGAEVWADDIDPAIKEKIASKAIEVKRKRTSLVPAVKWFKATINQIIERSDWVGTSIPIVRIIADEFDIEGKVRYSGIVRFSKDAQRQYNYWATKETEAFALAPNAPWVMEEGQIEGHENDWKNANRKPISVLQYRAVALGGTLAPPPQRQAFAGVPAGIVQAKQGAAEDMMATTGIRFDATPGERMYDESGRALRELRRSGDIGSFHITDNFARGLKRTGEILIDIIPKIYDTKRVLTILREDDSEERITLDPNAQQPVREQRDPNTGKVMKIYNPTYGKYGVTTTIGPSYATKRVEAAESMMDFIRALPQTGEMLADLVAKNQDWPGAPEMATRLAKAIAMRFPGVIGGDMKDTPPEVQAMLAEMQQQLQQLSTEREQMIKVLTDQQADRALMKEKIDKDFEAKVMTLAAKYETDAKDREMRIADTMMTHIAALTKNVESIVGQATNSMESPASIAGSAAEAPQIAAE